MNILGINDLHKSLFLLTSDLWPLISDL